MCLPKGNHKVRPYGDTKMPDELIELEEEEHTSQMTGETFRRIVGLVKPHWRWMAGFLVAIVFTAFLDAVFTYINKDMIDQGIAHQSIPTLLRPVRKQLWPVMNDERPAVQLCSP